jgi:hypothetical protein
MLFRNKSKAIKEQPSWMKQSEMTQQGKYVAHKYQSSHQKHKLLSNLPPKNMMQKRWVSSSSESPFTMQQRRLTKGASLSSAWVQMSNSDIRSAFMTRSELKKRKELSSNLDPLWLPERMAKD